MKRFPLYTHTPMAGRVWLAAAWRVFGCLAVGSTALAADAPSGKAVYDKWCAPCHAPGISVMPHFRKTEITDAELDALAQYLASDGLKGR